MKELNKIQKELKAPKNQRNNFGNYNYRSCEDIMEAVKPLLGECVLTISDEVVLVGTRVYVKASATLKGKDFEEKTTAFAREPETQKGMNEAQITGSASSYARKYALNGLFAIDDTKDADATNKHGKDETKPPVSYGGSIVPKTETKDLGKCNKCGADNVNNPKTGKTFCKEKCWLK